jgi:ABC-type multidrug transport system ATPase subunit
MKKNINIVKNVTFDVKKGEIFGIIGPSGAGKSTIFKMLSMFTARSSGHIEFFGHPF